MSSSSDEVGECAAGLWAPLGDADSVSISVPGRVCLIGEHSDWSGALRRFNSSLGRGRTVVCGTNHSLLSRAKRADGVFRMTSCGRAMEVPMRPDKLLEGL